MEEEHAGSASDGVAQDGLIARLQERGHDLARGRRLAMPLPGWELPDGRKLWARFRPLSRKMQQDFAWTQSDANQEADVIAPIIAVACEEILIGTDEQRSALADEPEVRARYDMQGPLGFGIELGEILGVGGTSPAACVKRLLIRSDDDLPLYAVWAELMQWSTNVYTQGVEVAAGE